MLVNLSRCVVELSGTIMLGIIHSMIGNSQAGMLLGMWVATLFGEAISGSHYNPAVTVVVMLRKNSSFGSRRLKGILYIVAQLLGGILQAFISIFLARGSSATACAGYGTSSGFATYISEAIGTFTFVFIFMLCTDKKTQFSNDRVINCFIIASAYVSARLMAGGSLISAHGPVLNPAIGLGRVLSCANWGGLIGYCLMPLGGSALALIFYEFVFVKS